MILIKANDKDNRACVINKQTRLIHFSAFSQCANLTTIIIPDSLTSIGSHAFEGCGLTSITIPDGVTSIGDMAFAYCRDLTSITIPDSVTSIDDYIFSDCTALTYVTFEGTVVEWDTIKKGGGWNNRSSVMEVVCSDGTVRL